MGGEAVREYKVKAKYILLCKNCDAEFIKPAPLATRAKDAVTMNHTTKICKRCFDSYYLIPLDYVKEGGKGEGAG